MTSTDHRPSVAARRIGYVIAIAVNAVLLYLINVWPGWEAVPFLTGETRKVVAVLNVSLAVSLLANVIFLGYDPPWWRSMSDLVTAAISLVVLVRIWQVFPFDFTGWSFDWSTVIRILLVFGTAGITIGMIVNIVALRRRPVSGRPAP